MTTEVLRNMIYAASPTLDGLRYVVLDEVHYLQDRFRGAVWEEVIIHLPPEVDLVCLSATVSNAEEVAAWMQTVRGATEAVIEERRPVELAHLYLVGERGAGALHLLPTFVGHGRDGRPNPEVERLDGPAPHAAAAAPGGTGGSRSACAGCARRGGPRSSSGSPTSRCCPRSCSCSAAPGATRRSSSASRRGSGSPTSDERRELRRIAERHVDGARRRRPRRARLRRVARRARGGVRRAPRRAGPADEGSGRGGVRGRAAEGRVRDRDALARHQHAGALGRHREAVEVHRRAPRVPDAGGVHPARRAGRAARHRRRRVRGRAAGARSCAFEQVAGLASRRTYALTSSFRPTYNMAVNLVQRYSAEQAPTISSTCRSRSSTPTATSSSLERQLEPHAELLDASARRRAERVGDVEEYRAARRRRSTARAASRGAGRGVASARSTRSGPATSRRGPARRPGRRAEAGARRTARTRVLALTEAADARAARYADDFARRPRPVGDIELPGAVRAAQPGVPARARSSRCGACRVRGAGRRATRDDVREAEAAVRGPPGAQRPGARRARPQRRPRPTGSSARSRASSGASGAAARASPASSTACSACSSAWGYVDGWALTDAGELLAGSTPSATSSSPSRCAQACSTGSTPPSSRRSCRASPTSGAAPTATTRCRRPAGRAARSRERGPGDRAALAATWRPPRATAAARDPPAGSRVHAYAIRVGGGRRPRRRPRGRGDDRRRLRAQREAERSTCCARSRDVAPDPRPGDGAREGRRRAAVAGVVGGRRAHVAALIGRRDPNRASRGGDPRPSARPTSRSRAATPTLAAAVADAGPARSGPVRARRRRRTSPRAVGLADVPAGRPSSAWTRWPSTWSRDDTAGLAVNMVVLGTPPDRLRAWHRRRHCTVTRRRPNRLRRPRDDGRGRERAVPARPRPRPAGPSRRRPARGPGVRARRRRAAADAPPPRRPAPTCPHPRIAQRSGRTGRRSGSSRPRRSRSTAGPCPARSAVTRARSSRSAWSPARLSGLPARPRRLVRRGSGRRRYHRPSHAVRAGALHRRRGGDAPAVLHEPRRAGLRARSTCPRS